jgi:hypothetical protein
VLPSESNTLNASRSDSLPDCRPLLQNIKIRHPIEQNMLGRSGLFRQQNIEKRRVYSLREWFEVRLILIASFSILMSEYLRLV